MGVELIRAFVSIELPFDVKTALIDKQETLQVYLPDRTVRWVDDKGVHLTLNFLGEITCDKVQALHHILGVIARRSTPFTLALGSLGCFPKIDKPRVIWIGLLGDLAQLHKIQADIQYGVEHLGHEPDKRKFSPHLTLGRVRRNTRGIDVKFLEEYLRDVSTVHNSEWSVTEIVLMQSVLLSSGAVYSALGRFPLTNSRTTTCA